MSNEATPKQRLLTPGPTQVPEAVLRELTKPIIHHRTNQFRQILAEVGQRLQRIFRTQFPVLTISGSGTTAFEAAQVSLVALWPLRARHPQQAGQQSGSPHSWKQLFL